MKRSEINAAIRVADEAFRRYGFHLPQFAHWSPEIWSTKGAEVRNVADCKLGWDITDFGSGDFKRTGLTLFTIRNGRPENLRDGGKVYCEKILLMEDGQSCPPHFHDVKVEDIINRAGGRLLLQLYNADPNGGLADSDVSVEVDGEQRRISAGDVITLHPGESVTLMPRCYHALSVEGGQVMIGEVSVVNDDHGDVIFLDEVGRFPSIEEDEPPLHLLCEDYSAYWPGAADISGESR